MLQGLKSLIGWYLGVKPAGSSETARWTLAWGRLDPAHWWIIIAVACAAVLMFGIALQESERLSRRWWRQMALRLAVLAVVAAWLGQLTLEIVHTGLPTLVVLIDTSASMGLEDRYPSEGKRSTPLTRGTRLEIAQQLLLGQEADVMRELAHRFKLHVYEFSEAVHPLGDSTTEADLNAVIAAMGELRPQGTETRPGPCLDQILEEFRGSAPAAAVVLTDGIASRTEGERLSAAQQPRVMDVPVYTIAVGSSEPALDLEIYDLQVSPTVFVGDTVAIDFTARASGLKGREAEFLLHREGQAAPLARTIAALPADGDIVPVQLALTPSEEGDLDLEIRAQVFEGETNRENNVLHRRVQVRRDQIRVLFVERAPRWEYRHLKSVLERDPNIELRTVLQESDLEHQQEDRTALSGFPARRDDLFAYDVVILGDVDLQYLNPGALESLREFVRTRGGGLILIAGERHNPFDFRGTPLESLLPVEIGSRPDPTSSPEPFRVAPVRKGFDHPLLRLGAESRESEFWERLPPLNWSLDAPVRQPSGVIVATRDGVDQRAAVILTQRFGAGQVLYHATDELWRWRKRVEDRYYGRYWLQAVRLLCRAQRLGTSQAAELTTDRGVYRQGDTVRFRLRMLDGSQPPSAPAEMALVAERRSGSKQTVLLAASDEPADEFTGTLPAAAAGEYHAWLATPILPGGPPTCEFSVELPHRELLRQAADVGDLQQAAQASGGRAVSFADVSHLSELLPRGATAAVLSTESIPIWARGEFLLLFVALLAAEWLLRRGT